MGMCFKSALLSSKNASLFHWRVGERRKESVQGTFILFIILFSDQWEPLRGKECIRTVIYYCKGGQVYGSGTNRTRLHALHGDA